jgi:hypothetical protein
MRRLVTAALVVAGALAAGCGDSESGGAGVELGGVRYEVESAKADELRAIAPRNHVVVRLRVENTGDAPRDIAPAQFTLRPDSGGPVEGTNLGVPSLGAAAPTLAPGDSEEIVVAFLAGRPVRGETALSIRAADGSGERASLTVDVEAPSKEPEPIGG